MGDSVDRLQKGNLGESRMTQGGTACRGIPLVLAFLSLFFLPVSHTSTSTTPHECCPTQKVENAPKAWMDGEYILVDEGPKREAICVNGCVYEKDGKEYCFVDGQDESPPVQNAEVFCQAPKTTTPGITSSPEAKLKAAKEALAAAQKRQKQ